MPDISYAELTELVRTTTARALVITGAGGSFCSGDDVSTTLGTLFATADHREGVRSFLEKREPRYVGR